MARRLSALANKAPSQNVVSNMVKMRHLDELSILRNLELRFNEDDIYTWVGTVLISVNPFRQLQLYTPDILERYSDANLNNPPHVFAVADRAYRALLQSGIDQSVIVSGESGAGKTEATKVFLEYLMEMSRRAGGEAHSSEATESLEELCLFAQTILEAFGNAKTVRNDNSSRFGKWIEVHFSRTGAIQGANINTYLLEKSRVVMTEDGERSYHIFYELLAYAASNPEIKARYGLGRPESFHYLSQSSVTQIAGVSDLQEFHKVREALIVFGMSDDDVEFLWRVLAAVLHLGNVQFTLKRVQNDSTSADGSAIGNPDVLSRVSDLLRIPQPILEKALLFHSYGTRSLVYIPYKPEEAVTARDALAKALYAGVFNYVGQRINNSLSKGGNFSQCATIGILDIFGFEILKTNGFEQLCINFCNERLQSHFNEECFRIEQEEYRAEGVQVEDIAYYDNQPCVDMLEQRPHGIFAMIDEEINTPGGDDKNLLFKLFGQHVAGGHLEQPSPKEGANCFRINHYAGSVLYRGDGIMEKSKDALHQDLDGALEQSDDPFVPVINASRQLSADVTGQSVKGHTRQSSVGKAKSRTQPTLGTQFCRQLDALMTKLHATTPHFIKCFKPNMEKKGSLFVAQDMLDQLRYTGVVGLCKIRQIGYPERMPLEEFALQYNPLCFNMPSPEELILALAARNVLKDGLWVLGTTKLLMKHEQHTFLAEALAEVQQKAAVQIQKHVKAWWARMQYRKMAATRAALRAAIQLREEGALRAALVRFEEDLPNAGSHLPEKAHATQLVHRLSEEKQAEAMIKQAIQVRDVAQLEAALTLCRNMQYQSAGVHTAQKVLAQLQAEQAVYDALILAIQAKERSQLAKALQKADAGGMDFAEVRQARALIARIDHQAVLTKRYETALSAGDVQQVDALLEAMSEAGFPLPANAKEHLANLEQQVARRALEGQLEGALEAAVEAGSVERAEQAIQAAIEQGCQGEALAQAQAFLQSMHKKKEDLGALFAACQTLQVKMESVAGIESSELDEVHACLQRLVHYTFTAEEDSAIERAQGVLQRGLQVQHCAAGLDRGVRTRDYNLLTSSLDLAAKYDLKMDIVAEARAMVEALEKEGPQIPAGSMEQILDIARSARWKFSKYRSLRSREAFAKGKYLNRKRCMDTMFQYSKEAIPNSLIDMPSAQSKIAVMVNKSLQQFCGVRRTNYPAAAGLHVLEKGKQVADLRDEIFVQLCKHLSANPDHKTLSRGWMLLCMCIDMFSPSVQFELHLLNFVAEHQGAEFAEFATYCLERLEEELDMDEDTLVEMVENKHLPSVEFITSVVNGEASAFLSRTAYY